MCQYIKASLQGAVATIRLNRPEKRNALNMGLVHEVIASVTDLAYAPQTKVLVLEGAGPAFCAGFDMSTAWHGSNSRERLLEFQQVQNLFEVIERAPVVKIAKIHGPAAGGGALLGAVCDLRYGGPNAEVLIPELEMGLPFSMGGVPRLARLVGLSRAADMILTGYRMSAKEAKDSGYLSRLFPDGNLDDAVADISRILASRPSLFLMEECSRMREAAELLLPGSRNDLVAMLAAYGDPESVEHGATYTTRFNK